MARKSAAGRKAARRGRKGGQDRYSDRVADLVRSGLAEKAATYQQAGRDLGELGSPEELAERMVATVPRVSPWDELLGPFYGTTQTCKLLGGISRQAVTDRRERRTLLGLQTADGRWVYPRFQFDERNEVIAGLGPVLQCFDRGVDGWTLAGWLVSPLRSLGGRSVVAWLRDGDEREPVLVAARDAARRFAQ